MQRRLITLAFLALASVPAFADDWPEFLGPNGVAKSSDIVPRVWDGSRNMLWKADLPGTGSSSPVIVGDRLIVTCYIADEPTAKRQVLCFDKVKGSLLWSVDYPIDYVEDRFEGFLTEHGYASNTPASDGEDIYLFFGKGGVHSIGLDGERNWSVGVGKESSQKEWGSAASLILFQDRVIVNASEESQSLIALDKSSGKQLWKQEAGMLELAYGTPRLMHNGDGQTEVILSVPSEVWAFDVGTGKLGWYCDSPMTGNVCPSVIIDGQTIYSFGGFRASGSIAVRSGGEGDVSDTHVQWTNRPSSYVATPLLHEGRFYWIDDRGIAYCTSAADGSLVYRERVRDLKSGRPVYASPVLVGEHIYVVTRRSGTIVYPPTDSFQPEERSVIASDDSDFNASPAVSDNRLYLRSNRSLYCISGSD